MPSGGFLIYSGVIHLVKVYWVTVRKVTPCTHDPRWMSGGLWGNCQDPVRRVGSRAARISATGTLLRCLEISLVSRIVAHYVLYGSIYVSMYM